MDTEEKIVSYLTINTDTRKIADEESRKDILLLKTQIEYLAEQLNITLPKVANIENNEE